MSSADDLTDIEDTPVPHAFATRELAAIRSQLLGWFDVHRRDLPWRRYGPSTSVSGGVDAEPEASTSTEAPAVATAAVSELVLPSPKPLRVEPEASAAASPPAADPSSPVKRPRRAAAVQASKRARLTVDYGSDDDDGADRPASAAESSASEAELPSSSDDDDDDAGSSFEDSDAGTDPRPRLKRKSPAVSSAAPATTATGPADRGQRAYEVWVSEIMCQQTQVATVIPYYEKWMARWPTVHALAEADIEEVNQAWAGLGYYSRGRRLLESARLLVEKYGGALPETAERLEKEIGGIGKYTAGAIASIAYGQRAPLVDGNVVRVLSRLRALGGDPKAKKSIDLHWKLAAALVDPSRPGPFNEALMELGALVCTPTSPSCDTCPIRASCWAATPGRDLSCTCDACSTWSEAATDPPTTATDFPRKPKKKAPREETIHVCLLHRAGDGKLLVSQRPATGLLAGMWEFPNRADMDTVAALATVVAGDSAELEPLGSVVHLFSHIRQTMQVYRVRCPEGTGDDVSAAELGERAVRWLTVDELHEDAVSTGMKKALALLDKRPKGKGAAAKAAASTKAKRVTAAAKQKAADPKQRSISAFFGKKEKSDDDKKG
ncbi:hypothetical protein H9P43_010048 [Blastocladiella emersonii ATCC 22665]|nr:hypothetical protein H9P43_010048 [Blastocladiella emersonii ATCC 22665]